MAEITHRGPTAKTEPDTDADDAERELPPENPPDDRARARAQAAEYLY